MHSIFKIQKSISTKFEQKFHFSSNLVKLLKIESKIFLVKFGLWAIEAICENSFVNANKK